MNKPLPKNVFLQGQFEPWPAECDINDITIIGKIPQELNGTFYRNGPNPQYVYSENYHMYEGDGMIHAVTLQNGRASYQNRWIRTEKFLAERQAQKSLFGGMRDFMACDDSVKNCSRNTANTNVVWHHGKLLALNEGGQPMHVNPANLTECNIHTFNQVLHRSMMAHPKIDPVTGELIFYSYLSPAGDFIYFIADKNGKITHQEKIKMPFFCMMHDFAITEHFSVFPVFPLTFNFERMMRRENTLQWEPHLNTHFVIIPRYDKNQDAIYFEDAACMGFHVVNAHEVGDQIILEMVVLDDISENAVAFADDNTTFVAFFTRWVFDLKTKKIHKERLDHLNMEFPRIDERYTGRNYRHAYMNATMDKNTPKHCFDSIVHHDLKNNTQQRHNFGKGSFPLEPVFVPRSNNCSEGDGFLLSYVYRETLKRSDLVILDAQHVDAEPLAVIQLPHRVPFGFHGCWVDFR